MNLDGSHSSPDHNSDCGDAADVAASRVFSRQNRSRIPFLKQITQLSFFIPNSAAPSPRVQPSAVDDLASPIAKGTGTLVAEGGGAVGESVSFLSAARDGDGNVSLGLDFSVGTFAGFREFALNFCNLTQFQRRTMIAAVINRLNRL